ncbi:MAG: hypothetical protein ACI4CT_07350 [Lachnospiraceae bacterium]
MAELKALNLPISPSETALFYVNCALEWIADNTTLDVDTGNPDSVQAMPYCAKMFLSRFAGLMEEGYGIVTSESMGPLSQSFREDADAKLFSLARKLLKKYMKGNVSFHPLHKRWK